ncbi:RHS repeat-associated core domain-containing protein, partial [Flavobacterium sp. RNTU_13]|uniref:RHS repeat-associated core domain-containing protein n=1 Tax=Flavobacterium sp. RNTU_13 TaxID=3375145 RepID=UPI00398794B0
KAYRYGFNGKEKDDEVKGEGDSYDYGFRMYDPRIARFMSIDPLTSDYPYLTPYQFASNRPLDGVDLDGKEWAETTTSVTLPDGTIKLTTELVIRVKVENQSTIITDPNIIKSRCEAIKTKIEKEGTRALVYTQDGKNFQHDVKTTVVLDYTPRTSNDGYIGRLIFDDRTSVQTVVRNGNTVTTSEAWKKGENHGEVYSFTTNIGITKNGKIVDESDMAETALHEIFGHSGGLNHPWELGVIEILLNPELNQSDLNSRVLNKIIQNFMNTDDNPDKSLRPPTTTSNFIEPGQIRAIIETVRGKSDGGPTTEELKKP